MTKGLHEKEKSMNKSCGDDEFIDESMFYYRIQQFNISYCVWHDDMRFLRNHFDIGMPMVSAERFLWEVNNR